MNVVSAKRALFMHSFLSISNRGTRGFLGDIVVFYWEVFGISKIKKLAYKIKLQFKKRVQNSVVLCFFVFSHSKIVQRCSKIGVIVLVFFGRGKYSLCTI